MLNCFIKEINMLKKIIINLLLIFTVFFAIEYAAFVKTKKENIKFQQLVKLESNKIQNYKTRYVLMEDFSPAPFRGSFMNKETNKKPVLWFGCSFAEGAGLEDNKTPCYKISQLTRRSCLNKTKGATGVQYMYYQLSKQNFSKEVPQADFIIYTFIWNHIHRLYNYQINPLVDMFNLRYKNNNGTLEEIKPVFKPLYSSFFIRRILNKKVNKSVLREANDFELFNLIMKETAELVKKYYPKSTFIMLEFPDTSRKELPLKEIKTLESYGIIVVRVKDLIGNADIYDDKYWLPGKIHPSEQAWDIILPELVKNYMHDKYLQNE